MRLRHSSSIAVAERWAEEEEEEEGAAAAAAAAATCRESSKEEGNKNKHDKTRLAGSLGA